MNNHKCCPADFEFLGYDPDPVYNCKICDDWWKWSPSGWNSIDKIEIKNLLQYRDTPRGKETAEYVARYKMLAEQSRHKMLAERAKN